MSMGRLAVLALTALVLALSACPQTQGSTDDSLVDTDPCANPPTQAEFAEVGVQFCDYAVSCPGSSEEQREPCENNWRQLHGGADCFNACEAAKCVTWLAGDPTCTQEGAPPDDSCVAAIRCEE